MAHLKSTVAANQTAVTVTKHLLPVPNLKNSANEDICVQQVEPLSGALNECAVVLYSPAKWQGPAPLQWEGILNMTTLDWQADRVLLTNDTDSKEPDETWRVRYLYGSTILFYETCMVCKAFAMDVLTGAVSARADLSATMDGSGLTLSADFEYAGNGTAVMLFHDEKCALAVHVSTVSDAAGVPGLVVDSQIVLHNVSSVRIPDEPSETVACFIAHTTDGNYNLCVLSTPELSVSYTLLTGGGSDAASSLRPVWRRSPTDSSILDCIVFSPQRKPITFRPPQSPDVQWTSFETMPLAAGHRAILWTVSRDESDGTEDVQLLTAVGPTRQMVAALNVSHSATGKFLDIQSFTVSKTHVVGLAFGKTQVFVAKLL